MESENKTQIRQIRTVTYAGMAVNLILALLKAAGGLLFHCQTLVADAVHSLSDLITDFAVIFGVKYWSAPPDREHPYGHGRIETLISAFIALALAAAGCALVYNAAASLIDSTDACPNLITFIIALLSIVSKEWLFRWTRKAAVKLQSKAVEANAWHHRSDALSSIPAALAIAISHFFPALYFIDAAGAIMVSCFIFYAAWKIMLPTLHELVDTGVCRSDEEKLYRLAAGVPGIQAVHALRTRNAGGVIWVDLHILVDPEMTVREGHSLSHEVRDVLMNSGMNVADAVIHIEPCTGK